jgi:oxygen-independent coproporphyrinogen-3 oxidase
MMNRAHNSAEAQKCLEEATKYFDNISLDLIYGVPGMSNEKWKQNIEKALWCITHLELCFDGRAQNGHE